MRFEEKFKNVKPGEMAPGGCYLRSDKPGTCCVCGRLCDFVEINYEAFFCSKECEDSMWVSPRQEPGTVWHSVSETPPKAVGDDGYTGYLVYSDGYMQVADYSTDRLGDLWFHVDGEYDPDVTHWMPLPPPPERKTL